MSINIESAGSEAVRSSRGDRYLSSLASSYNIRVSAEGGASSAASREESLPEFLRGSGVKGVEDVLRETASAAAGSASSAATAAVSIVVAAETPAAGEPDNDDVEWED